VGKNESKKKIHIFFLKNLSKGVPKTSTRPRQSHEATRRPQNEHLPNAEP
jgi:hypothetical protein